MENNSQTRCGVQILNSLSPVCDKETFDRDGTPRVAVQVHLFYPELLDEIIDFLNHIPYAFDCFVSTDSQEKRAQILPAMEQRCKCRAVEVGVFPNRGRDVAPLLAQMAPVLHKYDYLCHIHSKRTSQTGYGNDWRRYQFRHLLGSTEFIERLFYLFEQNEQLGIVFPESYPPLRPLLQWEDNKAGVAELLARLHYEKEPPPLLTFPAGNMFWARTKAVERLFALGLRDTDFLEEAGQVDGTLAHCVERAWVYAAEAAGYGYRKVFNQESASMIIPVIFSLQPMCANMMYAWVFCKSVDMAKYYHWPVFAQRQYFENKAQLVQLGLFTEQWGDDNDFEPYQFDFNDEVIRECFPEDIITRFLARYPSQTDAFIASVREPWPEMQAWLVERIRKLETQTGQTTQALMCLADTGFIRDAARELGIPVIHYEWGPFRPPFYRKTGMLDLSGDLFSTEGDMKKRYAAFEKVANRLPIFNRREILALFLKRPFLHYATDADQRSEYEIGLMFSYNIPHITTAYTAISPVEMAAKAQQIFPDDKIVVRYHPGDPVCFRLLGVQEGETQLPTFIRSCKRIACISSNLDYEAMLYGRPVYDLGVSQYQPFVNTSLDSLPDHVADDRFMSFIAFSYLIPYEMLKNADYLQWRLSAPSEEEIYLYHLNYYFNCLSLPQGILTLPSEERLKAIIEKRSRPQEACMEENIWMETTELTRMYVRQARAELLRDQLEKELTDQNDRLEELKQTLEKKEAQVRQKDDDLESATKELQRQGDELYQAVTQLHEKEGALWEANYELRHKTEELQQKAAELAQSAEQLRKQEADLAQMTEKLQQRENELTQVTDQLQQQENELTQVTDQLLNKDDELVRAAEQLRKQEGDLTQAAGELTRLHLALTETQKELQRIQSSKSWRIMSFFWRFKAFFTKQKLGDETH